jgi:LacI family transcriptional regulator
MLQFNDSVSTLRAGRRIRPASAKSHQPKEQSDSASSARTMRHVALLIESSGAYGRGLLQGIAKYNRDRGGWSTYFRPHGLGDPPPAWLRNWKGDGILMRNLTPELADVAKHSGVPVVNLRASNAAEMPFASVTVDNAEVARLAAAHLRERGLRNFAFCGQLPGINRSLDQRGQYFRECVERDGIVCDTFPAIYSADDVDWEREQERLARWITSLPKPVGIMACNDERGIQVLDACRRCGAAVPDEVAVIGVDNDEPICELSIPPLTSIDVNAEGIGHEAAALLDRMMSGETPASTSPSSPSPQMLVAPRGVVTRRSTDVLACEDQDVSRALRHIRQNACRGLQVVDVLAFMGMSRASLQLRMKQVAGRTIHQEIQRMRLAKVKELLVMSDLTIKQVARESGFASVQYMTRVFRAATGETPAKYRDLRAK